MGQLFNIFGLHASFPKHNIIFGIYLTKMLPECITKECKIILLKILHRCNDGKKISWLISVGNISNLFSGRKKFLFHTLSIWLHCYCTKKALMNYSIWCCHLLRNIRTKCPTTQKWWYKVSLEFFKIYREEVERNTKICWEYNWRGYEN